MNRTKCSRCGLVNLVSDLSCRRCGHENRPKNSYNSSPMSPREAAKRSSFLWTALFLALIGGAAYYLFYGFERSLNEVNGTDANRVAEQQANKPSAPLSRTEYEHQRAGQYGNAVQNSPGLAESQKRLNETKKLMQPETNSARH